MSEGAWSDLDELVCPSCHEDVETEYRACPNCGFVFRGSIGEEYDYDWTAVVDMYLENFDRDLDFEKLANDLYTRVKDRDGISESGLENFVNRIRENKEEILSKVKDPDTASQTEKLMLALAGINAETVNEHGEEEQTECTVCKKKFLVTQTQQHHISYLHDYTVTVCYSCHRKIHHEDGYYDELKPDISKKEAKKLKETGYGQQTFD